MQSWLWVGPSCRYVRLQKPLCRNPYYVCSWALTVPQHCSDAVDTGQCGQAQLQAVHMQAGTCWKHLPCSYLAAQQMHASLSAASWAALTSASTCGTAGRGCDAGAEHSRSYGKPTPMLLPPRAPAAQRSTHLGDCSPLPRHSTLTTSCSAAWQLMQAASPALQPLGLLTLLQQQATTTHVQSLHPLALQVDIARSSGSCPSNEALDRSRVSLSSGTRGKAAASVSAWQHCTSTRVTACRCCRPLMFQGAAATVETWLSEFLDI